MPKRLVRMLVLLIVASGVTPLIAECSPIPPGVVGWWPGDGTPEDLVGGHHGSISGNVSYIPGVVSLAFFFDEGDGHVVIPDSPDLRPTMAVTVDAWVRVDSIPDGVSAHLVDRHTSEQGLFFEGYLLSAGGPASFSVFTEDGQFIATGTTNILGDGRFHHLAGTYDGAAVKLYVDGVLEATTPASGPIAYSTLDLWLGKNQPSAFYDRRLHGAIDEVRIWQRALSACEVLSIVHAVGDGNCKGDADADGIPDFADNCPTVQNDGQVDDDGDGAGDLCDCAPNDPTVFAPPSDHAELFFTSRSQFHWCLEGLRAGPATLYDVMRGVIDEFPVGTGTSESCLASNLADTEVTDAAPIGPAGYYYLQREANACGVGGYGPDSAGSKRIGPACP